MLERLWAFFNPGVPATRAAIHTATDYGRDILHNSPDGWEHDQQFLWWTGPGSPNGFGNPPPDARDGGGLYGAAAIPAVMRCTAIIADTIAGLPWNVFRGFDQVPTPGWITDPQLLRPDLRVGAPTAPIPNALSHVEFWANWITSALWYGDGFAWAPRGRGVDGQLLRPFYLIHPQDVEYRDGGYWVGQSPLDMSEVLHLRGEPPYTGGMGQGVIDRHGADLGLAAQMRSYAGNIFSTGVPAGYLKVNMPQVTQDQADNLKARWLSQHGGPKRSIAVLNATTEFHPIALSPVDSQLDLARTWGLRDIALAFGVPAYMLGVPGDSSTYANVESRMTELQTFTLLPWIRRIEAALDAQFTQGVEVKINTAGTLRGDTSTRYAAYSAALAAGWMTVDEVRALEDRPPLPQQVSTDVHDVMPQWESETTP